MKYKIKFELDYSKMSKQEVRDSKINEVLEKNREMLEITIDTHVKVPSVNDIVDINGIDYMILSQKYKIESDCFTTIFFIETLDVVKKRLKSESSQKITQLQLQKIKSMYK